MLSLLLTYPSHDVTVDLNGHNLSACPGSPAFVVQAGYTLTVVDTSEEQTGSLTSGTGDGTFSPDATVKRALTVTILWRAVK